MTLCLLKCSLSLRQTLLLLSLYWILSKQLPHSAVPPFSKLDWFHDRNYYSDFHHNDRHVSMWHIYSNLSMRMWIHVMLLGQCLYISDQNDWNHSVELLANPNQPNQVNCCFLNYYLLLPWLTYQNFYPFCLLRCLPRCRQMNLSRNHLIPVFCIVCSMLHIYLDLYRRYHDDEMANVPVFDGHSIT